MVVYPGDDPGGVYYAVYGAYAVKRTLVVRFHIASVTPFATGSACSLYSLLFILISDLRKPNPGFFPLAYPIL